MTSATTTTTSTNTASERVVLPPHVIPIRYDLTLEPNLESFLYTGTVQITLKITQECQEIQLHAKELAFESATVTVGNATQKAEEIHVNLKQTTVKFLFPSVIAVSDQVQLVIQFTGCLNNQMSGFYRSTYKNIHGDTCIMASTQFEALDARRCFPCVDEPAAKAVFAVTLTIPSSLTCFSNMPIASKASILVDGPGGDEKSKNKNAAQVKTRYQFMDTPKMSTYLLAFCVGEFDSLQKMTQHGVVIQVYTPVGKAASGQFALDCAAAALDLYDDFFAQPYPLPKLDMVAIPEFAMGAMENWGLVTYREVDLLIDPVTASNVQKQRVATVVSHELAHQWFGNLVTMEWWNGLWLNESFASWSQNWATDKLHPEYKMWDQFVTNDMAAALRLDSLRSSHPIDVTIRHAEEVNQVFDCISYCKGAAVIRMIQAVLGMKHFQAGLQQYMKDYAYQNTASEHLWNAWETVSQMPVQELMGSWTFQMGFPLLKVISEDWTSTDGSVTLELEQEWFLADGSKIKDEESGKLWTIPIIICTEAGQDPNMTLMREKKATVTVPCQQWIKLNAGQEVPMRVLPTEEMLKRCADMSRMTPIDRAGLITDAYALVKAGHMKPEAMIQLLGYYKTEQEYVVWEGISAALQGLDSLLLEDESMAEHLRQFSQPLVMNLLNQVGWDPQPSDAHLTTMLRGLVIGLVSTFCYKDPSVIEQAKTRFAAFLEDPTDVKSLPSDMRAQVFRIVLLNGGATEYEAVKSYYFTAADNAEKKHVLNSLGSVPDPALKLATMDFAVGGQIKLQDFFYVMGSVSRSDKAGRDIAWKYFQDHFDKITKLVENAHSALTDACIIYCCGGFCSLEKAAEVESFFQSHPLPRNTRKIEQTLEHTRANANFLQVLQASELSKDAFWASL